MSALFSDLCLEDLQAMCRTEYAMQIGLLTTLVFLNAYTKG
jgi:hypothetical protein